MYRVKSFQNIVIGVVIRPASCCSVTLFLECYANAVFTGHEGGLEPRPGHLVGKHLALPTLGIQCLAPSGGTITSIMRGNTFLRHFGYAALWHMGFCECACQPVVKGGTCQPHQHWGPLPKGNPDFFSSWKQLETVFL